MTFETVKAILDSNNISYEICHYSGEADFYRHIILFPYVKNAKSCKVTTIVIRSKNGHKNTELQFDETKDGTVLWSCFLAVIRMNCLTVRKNICLMKSFEKSMIYARVESR